MRRWGRAPPDGKHCLASRGDVLGVDRFGTSVPRAEMPERYGFTVDNVRAQAWSLPGKEE